MVTKSGGLWTAYNVPELSELELVLDFDVIAGIYLNDITMWNDQRILDLNSAEVAAALPAQAILVISQSVESITTTLFTTVLSSKVPQFAAAVRDAGSFRHSSPPHLTNFENNNNRWEWVPL